MKQRLVLALVCGTLLFGVPQTPFAQSNRALEERLMQQEARIARLERLLDNPALIDAIRRLDTLEEELRLLRGDAESNRHEIDALRTRQRDVYLDVDQRLQRLEEGGSSAATPATPTPAPATPAPARPVTPAAPAASTSGNERQEYQQALDMLLQGRNTQAASAFAEFVRRHPRSGFAANAQYWLGEARYVGRDFQAARVEFQKVLDQYPDSNKAPDARLKLGFTYYELEQWEPARQTLNEVVRLYPNTTFSHLAEQRLQRLRERAR
ncbi:tol-pal system protein YbgF [Thiorhodospira sibirica]|uniref:tol-pal system protein YbgF n=1 Tax=Thiorhodospira sibirica TaxID=154347 RepID=UPI00022C051F|nr:tol-pal system protein YbgF [Thiorhodospira sibirica]